MELEYRKSKDGSISTHQVLLVANEDIYYNLKNAKVYRGSKQMKVVDVEQLRADNPEISAKIDFIAAHSDDLDPYVINSGHFRPAPTPPEPAQVDQEEAGGGSSHSHIWDSWLADGPADEPDQLDQIDEDAMPDAEFTPLRVRQNPPKGVFSRIRAAVSGAIAGARGQVFPDEIEEEQPEPPAPQEASEPPAAPPRRVQRNSQSVPRREERIRRQRQAAAQREPTAWEWAQRQDPEQQPASQKWAVLKFLINKLLTIGLYLVVATVVYVGVRILGEPYGSARIWAVAAFGLCLILWGAISLVVSVYRSGNTA